ncbi:MAG TPA: DsbC family protein [Rhodocyclaceae bacterium]
MSFPRNNPFAAALVALALALPLAAQANDKVSAAFEKAFRVKPEKVTRIEAIGLYEIVVGGDILYTDEKVTHLIQGSLIDVKTRTNLTEERLNKLLAINFAELPLDLAVKQVRGNGKATLVTFEDPNCGYCKRLARDLTNLEDTTIYTFLYPILSADSTEKSRAIWCAKDRARAWNDWMIDGKAPTAATCDAPLEQLVELGQRYRVTGTPTIFFTDGSRAPGAIPLQQIRERLAKIAGK